VGTRIGAVPGFIDQSMKPGVEWEAELFHALENASVFVALLSANYVNSSWCGKEWDAFSRRRPQRVDGKISNNQTTILPVLWAPFAQNLVPPVVQVVQRFAPSLQVEDELRPTYQAYLKNGIYGLLSTARYKEHYDAVVWHLALSISNLFHNFRVPPGDPLSADQLRNVFERKAS
jgi:hypothetical protein